MVLSEKERRALAEIESNLRDADPRFARRMRGAAPGGTRRTRAQCSVVAVVAGVSAALCLVLSLVGPAVLAAVVALAALQVRAAAGPARVGPPRRSSDRW